MRTTNGIAHSILGKGYTCATLKMPKLTILLHELNGCLRIQSFLPYNHKMHIKHGKGLAKCQICDLYLVDDAIRIIFLDCNILGQ